MKKTALAGALLVSGTFLTNFCFARESNLINNNSFSRGLYQWFFDGKTKPLKLKSGVKCVDGTLSHYPDIGNLEHADPQCGMPAFRPFRFRVSAKGEGSIRLTVRARRMYAGNALEFGILQSKEMPLTGKVQDFDFESTDMFPETVCHDKLSIEVKGKAIISNTCFFYLDRNDPVIRFQPEAAVALQGDTVKVKILTNRKNHKFRLDLYSGQFMLAGYNNKGYGPMLHDTVKTDEKGAAEYSFKIAQSVQDGMRLCVSDPASGAKQSFFATILPEKQLAEMKEIAKKVTPKGHLLFLGDSLTDYDRGRNYTAIVSTLLGNKCTIRNAGVGGDTLSMIRKRLCGEKAHRSEMYKDLFNPMPDTIFLFCGGNDTKTLYSTGYKTPILAPEKQQGVLEEVLDILAKKAPGAKIVLTSIPASYLPWQKSLTEPQRDAKVQHSLFGLPEHTESYNDVLRSVAKKRNIPVIELGPAMAAHPDRMPLYVPDDGVHLSLKGHQFYAKILLDFLAEMSAENKSLYGSSHGRK